MNKVLRVSGVGKSYAIHAQASQRLRLLCWGSSQEPRHWSLQNVNFELQRGQCLGVIGDNGAGKSTLLKLLAGTLQPSTGHIELKGRLTAILELGAGFHPEFTGRDNVHFAGGFMGLDVPQLQAVLPDVLEFAQLGEAIDRPLKTYSSGMVVRLAFALVTAVQPDVLIIDEALAVGDQHFQKKCVDRIAQFRSNGCTILFCSHSLYHVRQLCDQVLWLDRGQVKALGPTEEVMAAYETHVRLQSAVLPDQAPTGVIAANGVQSLLPQKSVTHDNPNSRITQATLKGLSQGDRPVLQSTDVQMSLHALTPESIPPSMGFMIEQYKGVGIMSIATHAEGVKPVAVHSDQGQTEWTITLTLTDLPLHSGTYVLSFYLFDAQGLVVLDEWKDHIVFDWISPRLTPGLVRLPHVWS